MIQETVASLRPVSQGKVRRSMTACQDCSQAYKQCGY